jgi:RNA polymerase sigma factor (sigma-70 family)
MATAAPEIPVLARDLGARDLAFERLYRRYVKDVYHYALAMLRNPADAEDVTQTTFLNAYRAFKRGEEPLKPHNWLIKIAHNAARTRYARSMRRVSEVPLDDHLDALAVADDEKPDLREVLDALGRLPLNQRAALVMRELEGRSYADIAETLSVSVPAVETLIFRARRSLKVKASSVKALGAVPLPSSLAQLLGGGTVVAGSGAIGSGVLLKAAVALVAGVVATGVTGGDHGRPAGAATVRGVVAAPPWKENGLFARAGSVRSVGRTLERTAVASRSGAGPGVVSHRRHSVGETTVSPQIVGGVDTAPSTPSTSPPSSPVPTTASVPSLPVSTEPVTQALPPVSVSTPALPVPVQPPSVPTVSLPSPPPLPTLP